jgi:hypothetical protein
MIKKSTKKLKLKLGNEITSFFRNEKTESFKFKKSIIFRIIQHYEYILKILISLQKGESFTMSEDDIDPNVFENDKRFISQIVPICVKSCGFVNDGSNIINKNVYINQDELIPDNETNRANLQNFFEQILIDDSINSRLFILFTLYKEEALQRLFEKYYPNTDLKYILLVLNEYFGKNDTTFYIRYNKRNQNQISEIHLVGIYASIIMGIVIPPDNIKINNSTFDISKSEDIPKLHPSIITITRDEYIRDYIKKLNKDF